MDNKLQVIVNESGLEETKAKFILTKFQDYFDIAAEWENKAKTIKVTDETQTADMAMARAGRLFLKEKRINIEKARKELKEQALREGKAIDGIANVLKALIVPIEEYLDKQEHFIEIRAKEKEEQMRIEAEKKAEEERIAKEKAEAEEQKRIRKENEKLKKEAEERERKIKAERKKQEELLVKERAEAKAKQEAIEEEARIERKKAIKEKQKQENKLKKEREIAEAERKKAEDKARKDQEKIQAKAEKERKEKERLAKLLANQVTCPKCGHKFQVERKNK